jgi:hypothetical protein
VKATGMAADETLAVVEADSQPVMYVDLLRIDRNHYGRNHEIVQAIPAWR